MSKIVKKAMDDYFEEYERKREAKYPKSDDGPVPCDGGFSFDPIEIDKLIQELEEMEILKKERDND